MRKKIFDWYPARIIWYFVYDVYPVVCMIHDSVIFKHILSGLSAFKRNIIKDLKIKRQHPTQFSEYI